MWPTDQLRAAVDRVVEILEDPALRAREKDRRRAIREVGHSLFDWQETARRSLGVHWRQRLEAERARFVRLFRDLLEQTYLAKIERYRGEKVTYVGESVDDSAVGKVRTLIDTKRDRRISVDYLMRRRGERWLVYDVLIENVSLARNYRSQFSDIVRTSSYAELLKKMEAKILALSAADQ